MEMQVSAVTNYGDEKKEASVNYDFGDSVEDMIEKFGPETVYANARAQMVINLQAAVRRWVLPKEGDPELTQEQLQEKANEWQPGNRQVTRKSKAEKISALLAGMSAEEKTALLQKIKGITG